MTDIGFGALLFGVCLMLVALRMPVAVAMFVVGGFGFASLASWPAFFNLLNTAPFGRVSSYTLSVLPLFLLMGHLATRAGLSRLLFDAARACVGHRRGGLAVSTIGGCAGFGAVCGSSIATGATMAAVALPEMRRHGYSGALATGTLAAAWQEVLGVEPSIDDSFFELGGDSVLAVRVMQYLRQSLGADLPVMTLYRNPTIRDMSVVLKLRDPTSK